jgi:hypothetical protein
MRRVLVSFLSLFLLASQVSAFELIQPTERKNYTTNDYAFLYGKEIDPEFGLYRKATGKDFGEHADYVAKNYSGKAKDIQVYSTSKASPSSNKIKVNGSKGVDSEIETAKNVGFDAAGHRQVYGTDASGNQYTMEQDIWKFKPKEYMKKWLDNNEDV